MKKIRNFLRFNGLLNFINIPFKPDLIAALQCSIKPSSKAVTSLLKLMYKQIETKCITFQRLNHFK